MTQAIEYKDVRKAAASDAEAGEIWRQIGDITGAGHIPVGPDGAASPIDISTVSDSKRERIEKLLNPVIEADVVIDEQKRGKK